MEQPKGVDNGGVLTSNANSNNSSSSSSSTKPKQARIGPFVRKLFTHSSNPRLIGGQFSPESDITAKHLCSCDISNLQDSGALPNIIRDYSIFGEEFTEIERLDGSIYKARYQHDSQVYCVKKFVTSNPTFSKVYNKLFGDISSLMKADHPNVLFYKRAWLEWALDGEECPSPRSHNLNSSSSTLTASYITTNGGTQSQKTIQPNGNDLNTIDEITLSEISASIEFEDTAMTLTEYNISEFNDSDHDRDSDIDSEVSDFTSDSAINHSPTEHVSNILRRTRSHNPPPEAFNPQLPSSVSLYIQSPYHSYSLQNYLAERTTISRPYNIHILKQIILGLGHLHSCGLPHGNIKPSSILIFKGAEKPKTTKEGPMDLVKLGDLSINLEGVKVTRSLLDDPNQEQSEYRSPEQIKHGAVSDKSDIYSLGLVLFELFQIFGSAKERKVAFAEVRKRVLPPSFLRMFPNEAAAVLWLMSPKEMNRPSTAEILRSDFMRLEDQVTVISKKDLQKLEVKLHDQESTIQQQENIIKQQEKQLKKLQRSLYQKVVGGNRSERDEKKQR